MLDAGRWRDALAGWKGDLAPGFHVSGAPEFERWLDEQRAAFRRTVADAGWRRVDEMEKSRESGIGEAARRAWAIDPTNEAGARRLIRLLDATTGRAAALRAYDDLVDFLQREYETAPSAETRALAEQLSAPAPSVTPAAPSAKTLDVTSSAPQARPRRRLGRSVLVGMAILVTAGGSIVALRSPRSVHSGSLSDEERRVVPPGALQLPARYRVDTSAYGSYLRGLSLRFQGHHSEALDTFAALVGRAPQYPPGLAGLAHSYALAIIAGLTPPSEGWPKVEQAARRAIELDSALGSAYLALASFEISWRWDLSRAGTLIDKAIALDPGDAEPHAVRAFWFRWREELDSALAETRIAHKLDPLNASFSERVARHLYFLRRYPEAEAVYQQTLRDYPGVVVYGGLVDVLRAEGRQREALDLMRTGRELRGDSVGAAEIPVATSDTQATRMFAEMARAHLHALVEGARRGDQPQAYDWAFAYAGVRDTGETIRWLDSMRVGRDPALWQIPIFPSLDFVRNDPRYQVWLAKLPWRHHAP